MEKRLGALWKRTNAKGEFYTGVLENEDGTKQKIIIFKNGYKQKDTQPDYLILKAREQQDNFNINTESADTSNELPF